MKKRFLNRDRILYFVVMILSVLFLYVGNRIAVQDNSYFQSSRADTYYRAEVIAVGEPQQIENTYDGWSESYIEQDITIRLREGALRGEEVTVHQQLQTPKEGYKTFPYEVGDQVFAGFNFDSQMNADWFIADHLREMPMLFLVLAFFALLIGFGRFKGFNTVVSLVLTCAAVFFVMIPAIIKGYNIYLVTFITAVFTIVMTLCIVIGVHPKSIAAAVGCTCGVGFAGLLTIAMQDALFITGLIDEDSSFVMYINADTVIDLRGVIFAAIVIGALGATMDVAMSIASSLDEILYHKPDIRDWELMRSGLNIGRDIMGTMANTLVLAYVGSSLHMILLLLAYNNDIGSIINRETIAVELLQSVAGSIGILLTVPSTAVVPEPCPAPEGRGGCRRGSRAPAAAGTGTGGMCGSRAGCSGGAGRGYSRAGSAPDGGRTVAGIPKEGKITGQPGKTGSFPMGRRCFAKKAILFLYGQWYNSCKGSYYTCFMAGRSAGAACSRPIGQLYHFASLHGIMASERLPNDPASAWDRRGRQCRTRGFRSRGTE